MASAASAQNDDFIEHRLKADESPFTLARDYLASPAGHRAIMQANRITDPRRIPVGTVIRLPRNLLAYRPVNLRVEAFSGAVTINGQPATRGMALPEGAAIRTGRNGFVSLRGESGSVLTMPTNTHAQLVRARIYRLDNLQDIELKVLGGRGEAIVPGLRPRERFRIGTPGTVSAVRGTTFRVGHDETGARSVVEVVEGAVATAAGAQEALTGAGFGIAATPGGLGAQERLAAPPEITAPGAIQTQPTLSFAIALRPPASGPRSPAMPVSPTSSARRSSPGANRRPSPTWATGAISCAHGSSAPAGSRAIRKPSRSVANALAPPPAPSLRRWKTAIASPG